MNQQIEQYVTELEARLAQPDGDELRRSLEMQLAEMAVRLRAQIASSVPRGEYADWEAAADAVGAAQMVLKTWVKGEKNGGCNLRLY